MNSAIHSESISKNFKPGRAKKKIKSKRIKNIKQKTKRPIFKYSASSDMTWL